MNRMKKGVAILLLVCILLAAAAPCVFAETIVDSGQCTDTIRWTLDSEGTLRIFGKGKMNNYWWTDAETRGPWSLNPAIRSVIIEDGITYIGSYSFNGCTNLTSISIPSSVTGFGEWAFSSTGLTSINIPESVTSLGANAFCSCAALTSITIPKNVTFIMTGTFNGCTSLKAIWVDADNPVYSSDDVGVLFNKNQTDLIMCPPGFSGAYTVPSGVINIGSSNIGMSNDAYSDHGPYCTSAFSECLGLTSVIIPESVREIRFPGFYDCTSLTSVCFKGNAPKVSSGVFNTSYGGTGLTLYYIEGKRGWTSPTWGEDNYPTATWDGINIPAVRFRDVSPAAWYAGAVDYAVSNELMNGVGNGKFEPNGSMTRAMLVTVLWRYAGSPTGALCEFSDVSSSDVSGRKWYTPAVAWASENGVVNGVGNGRFDPNGKITREQIAVILFRYAKQQGIYVGKRGSFGRFADANKVNSYAVDALRWAVGVEIIGGSSEGGKLLLKPQGNATRAEVAAILMRFLENVMK